MINLKPDSENHRFIRAATNLVGGIYPLGVTGPEGYEQASKVGRCIETARALVATLQNFDLPAKLMPVDILVMNPPAFSLQKQGIPVAKWPDEAWSVGIVDDPNAAPLNDKRTGGWDGHMLVRIARQWMCDPNAGQFTRPGKIAMPGSWTIEYPRDQWTIDSQGWALQGIVNSNAPNPQHPQFPLIQVRQRPDNTAWQHGTAATNDISAVVKIATQCLELLREGKLNDTIRLTAFDGEEVDLDISQVITRYQE